LRFFHHSHEAFGSLTHLGVPSGVFHLCCCLGETLVFHGGDHFLEVSETVGAKVKPHVHQDPAGGFRQQIKRLEDGFQIFNAFMDIIFQQHQCFFFRDAFVLKIPADADGQLASRAMVGFQSQAFVLCQLVFVSALT